MISTRRGSEVLFLTCAVLIAISIGSAAGWRSQQRPRIFGNRVQLKMLNPDRPQIRRKILSFHNMFRSRVRPTAKDMLAMTWHPKAAAAAKMWSEQCQFLKHDSAKGRFLPAFGACGQNIFVSTQNVPWFFAIKMWFLEKDLFKYNATNNNLTDVGHYTQLVWASTHKVGCGISKCDTGAPDNRTYFSYVCNYCPIGNYPESLGRPYAAGPWCSACEHDCNSRRLCTNSCPFSDRWTNCDEMYRSWPHWLCKGRGKPAHERRANCQATCKCRDKNLLHV